MEEQEPCYRILGKVVTQKDLYCYLQAVITLNLLDDQAFIKLLPRSAQAAKNRLGQLVKNFSKPNVVSERMKKIQKDGSILSEKLQAKNQDVLAYLPKKEFITRLVKNIHAERRLNRLNPRTRAVILQRRTKYTLKNTTIHVFELSRKRLKKLIKAKSH